MPGIAASPFGLDAYGQPITPGGTFMPGQPVPVAPPTPAQWAGPAQQNPDYLNTVANGDPAADAGGWMIGLPQAPPVAPPVGFPAPGPGSSYDQAANANADLFNSQAGMFGYNNTGYGGAVGLPTNMIGSGAGYGYGGGYGGGGSSPYSDIISSGQMAMGNVGAAQAQAQGNVGAATASAAPGLLASQNAPGIQGGINATNLGLAGINQATSLGTAGLGLAGTIATAAPGLLSAQNAPGIQQGINAAQENVASTTAAPGLLAAQNAPGIQSGINTANQNIATTQAGAQTGVAGIQAGAQNYATDAQKLIALQKLGLLGNFGTQLLSGLGLTPGGGAGGSPLGVPGGGTTGAPGASAGPMGLDGQPAQPRLAMQNFNPMMAQEAIAGGQAQNDQAMQSGISQGLAAGSGAGFDMTGGTGGGLAGAGGISGAFGTNPELQQSAQQRDLAANMDNARNTMLGSYQANQAANAQTSQINNAQRNAEIEQLLQKYGINAGLIGNLGGSLIGGLS